MWGSDYGQMIYVTGDCHADFRRFSTQNFPEQKGMTRKDFVIVCGDFGGIWTYGQSNAEETYWLDWLAKKPFTLLFVDGNHENFDRLYGFPSVAFHGGRAHRIRDNIFHLKRGYVFRLQGKSFFAFGGARCHDIQDGILKAEDYSSVKHMIEDYRNRTNRGEMLRIDHVSWWAGELPNQREMDRGIRELDKVNNCVDYVISHCLPTNVQSTAGFYESDILTDYFNSLIFDRHLRFGKWYCGHYHREEALLKDYIIKYHQIERIV